MTKYNTSHTQPAVIIVIVCRHYVATQTPTNLFSSKRSSMFVADILRWQPVIYHRNIHKRRQSHNNQSTSKHPQPLPVGDAWEVTQLSIITFTRGSHLNPALYLGKCNIFKHSGSTFSDSFHRFSDYSHHFLRVFFNVLDGIN